MNKNAQLERTLMRHARKRGMRLVRKGLSVLPRGVRHACYRNLLRLPVQARSELSFKLAETREELEAAFRILHDAYVAMGFMTPDPSGMRVTLYHALPTTSTLIACWNGEVIGTVSVVRDGRMGLPVDKIFDTTSLKAEGAPIAEISALAIKKEYRGDWGEVLFPLLKFLYTYCENYLGVERLVIATHPNRADFYEGLFFFEPIPSTNTLRYDYVNGAPAEGWFIDLKRSYRRCAAHYGTKDERRDVFSYFLAPTDRFHFPDRTYFKVSDPIMTPELLDHFFNRCTSLFSEMSPEEVTLLTELYDHRTYAGVFPTGLAGADLPARRRGKRYDVNCPARIVVEGEERTVGASIQQVSAMGFRALLEESVRFGSRLLIRVMVGDFTVAQVEGSLVWNDPRGACGVEVSKACRNWKKFIKYLENDLIELPTKTLRRQS